MMTEKKPCLFCKIYEDNVEGSIIYKDDVFFVIMDIRPAAPHHYLIMPQMHYDDVKNISSSEIPLLESMAQIGLHVLSEQGGDPNFARLGFHWPPFHSVRHLHLHVIAPECEMGIISRVIFKTNSWWFISPETAIQRLKDKDEET